MMKHYTTTLCRFAIVTFMVNCSYAQDESSEPIELTRLREQFSNRIETEMKPWRDRYAQELQKLEDRLIKDRKLSEALAVKKEKENYMAVDFSKKSEKSPIPMTAEKAKEALVGSVWFVYESTDKKREKLLDVYHVGDADYGLALMVKQSFSWSVKSADQVSIQFPASEIKLAIDFEKSIAYGSYNGKNYVYLLVGNSKVDQK